MKAFRIKAGFWSDPALSGVGNAAVGLWARAGSYAVQHDTDGHVPTGMVGKLGGRKRDADALVRAGLWDTVDGGYQFRDWSRTQATKAKTDARRRADADRQARRRAGAGDVDNSPTTEPAGGDREPVVVSLPDARHTPARSHPHSAGQESASRCDTGVTSGVTGGSEPPAARHIPATGESVSADEGVVSRRDTGVTGDPATSDGEATEALPYGCHTPATGEGLFPDDELASRRDSGVTSRAYTRSHARTSCFSSYPLKSLEEENTQRAYAGEARPERRAKAARDEAFERFYEIYPRKKERRNAEKAWHSAIKGGADPEALIQGARDYRDACANHRTEPRYIKHPATWIRAGCWEDEYDALPAVSGGYRAWTNPTDLSAYEEEL